jgi:intracellular multiplication protein IcmG
MANQDDKPLELDDDFDQEFDQGLDDGFYDETLDEAFEGEFDEDFGVEDSGFEDELPDDVTETLDDNWNDQTDTESDTGKSKSGFKLSFNTIVIGGAVLLGAGVFYMQFMKSPNNANGERFASSVNMQGATDGTVFGETGDDTQTEQVSENNNQETSQEETGFLFEPDVLDSMEVEITDTPPQPVPVADIEEEGVNVQNIEDVGLVEPVQNNINLDQSEETIAETSENLIQAPRSPVVETRIAQPQVEETPDLSEVMMEESSTTSQNAQTNMSLDANLAALKTVEEKLDVIATRLNKIDERIDNVVEDNNTAIQELTKDLKQAEVKLSSAQKAAASNQVMKSKPAAVKTSVQKKVAKPAVSKPKIWELKAAQPGKAWVSSKGSQNIKAVTVGDNLEGLGRITAISFNNGQWIVSGTNGKITQ